MKVMSWPTNGRTKLAPVSASEIPLKIYLSQSRCYSLAMKERPINGAIENRAEYYLDSEESLLWRGDAALEDAVSLFDASKNYGGASCYSVDNSRESMVMEKKFLLCSTGCELYAVAGLQATVSRRNDDFSLLSRIVYSSDSVPTAPVEVVSEYKIVRRGKNVKARVRFDAMGDGHDSSDRSWSQMVPYDFIDLSARYEELEQSLAVERETL